jgi:hypothetical protein
MAIHIGSTSISALYLGSTAIPKAYLGAGEVYSVGGGGDTYAVGGESPAMVLDFTEEYYRTNGATASLGDAVTFTRASSATYVDSTGTLQTVGPNEPRVGHHVWSGSEWVNKGLLLESEQLTNLETESVSLGEHISHAAGGATTTYGSSDPFGGSNAGLFTSTSTDGYNYGTVFSLAASTYTFSVWLKANSSSNARIQLGRGSARDGVYADVDLALGTIGEATLVGGSYTPVSSNIEKFPDGWYRASVTAIVQTGTNVGYIRSRDEVGTAFYFYGPQLEEGSTPSSYIPTNGSQATRAAEAVESDNLPYSSTAMSGAIAGTETFGGVAIDLFKWSADAGNHITVTLNANGTVTLAMVNGGSTASVTTTGAIAEGVNTALKVAWRVTDSEINIALDGTAETAVSTAIGIPDLSSTSASFGGMGTRDTISAWDADIGDSGIVEVTSDGV